MGLTNLPLSRRNGVPVLWHHSYKKFIIIPKEIKLKKGDCSFSVKNLKVYVLRWWEMNQFSIETLKSLMIFELDTPINIYEELYVLSFKGLLDTHKLT